MRRNKVLFFTLIVSLCILFSASVAMAASSGGMAGQVRGWTASQKASGAIVTAYLKQPDGSYAFQAASPPADVNGNYSITLLPAGTYRVSYSHPTFGLMWYNESWTQAGATDQVVTSSGLGAFALQFVKTSVPVTFDFGMGLGTSSPAILPSVGDLLTQPTTPSNPGYQLAGWYSDPTFTTAWNFATSTVPASPLTLYAKWVKASYAVAYNSNGGSAVGPQSVQFQSLVTAPTPAPTRAYYSFGGWYKDVALTTAWNFATDTMPANAMTLYAKWIPNTYTVAFNSYGGSVVPSIFVDYNALVPQPLSPTREGYTFVGWYSDAALTTPWNFASGLMGPGNITLYAKWSTNSYAVSYDSNGGTAVSGASVAYGTYVTEPVAPTKSGYSFIGWYSDAALTSPWAFTTSAMPASAITLYAKWSINSYDVTYISNGGSSTADETVVYNALVTKPADPSKDGYSFIGWYSNESLTTSWNFTTDTMPAHAVTLYAKWDANHYTSSFNSNGGSSVDAQEVDFGGLITKPANPTKEGYTFTGWFRGTSEWNFTTDTMPMGGVNLSAHWVINTYVASFNSAGGTPVDSQNIDFGGLVTKPADPTKEGYSFEGWFSGASVWNFSTHTMPANDIELTAHWSVNNYPVLFDSNNGSMPVPEMVDFGALVTKPANPTKEGYTFNGWFNETTEWDFAKDKMPANGIVLVAHWSINTYTVTFNSDGGTPVDAQTVDFGGLVTQPADPARLGYTFVCWSYMSSAWDFASNTLPANDIELVAEWKINTYTASFNADGGTPVDSLNVDFGSLITKPADPTKEGYIFDGWFNGETKWDFAKDTMPADGVNLSAHWTPISYKATFDPANGASIESQDVDFNALVTQPADPTLEGYTFRGWFNGETKWDFANDTMPVDGVLLTAQWEINSYVASFNSNGGGSVSHQDVYYGDYITNPTEPIRTGYTFVGWFNGGFEWDFANNTMPAHDVELYAAWDAKHYTATFDSNGGSAVDSQVVDFEGIVTKPTDPTKEGYTFEGWFNGETKWDFANDTMPVDGVNLTAHWKVITYIATFDSNGGSAVDSQDVDFGSLVTKPADPTKAGYTFAGWFNGTTEWNFDADVMPVDGVSLTAHWTVDSYVASFDSDGGSAVDSQDLDFGSLIAKPADPTKEGYAFSGWFNGATEWDFVNDTMPVGDVTLTAHWSVISYTASFDSNGGSAIGSQDVNFGSLVTQPTDPTKEGYTFAGWFNAGNEWDFANNTMPAGELELYAAWNVNSYTASFDSNGGSAIGSQDVDFGSLVTKPADPTRAGYTFAGWFDGSTEWDFANDTMPADGVNLTAHWSVISYTASFDSDGGSAVDSQDVDFGSLVIRPVDPTRAGYTFAGWFDGKHKWNFASNTMPVGGVDLTALWTINSYTAAFNSDGGSAVDSQDVSFGSLVTKPVDPTKEGYTFEGWFDGSNEWDFANDTMPVDGVNLTAHWKVITYTAAFDSDGGSAIDSQSVDYAAHITEPADPTRLGYGFVGWFLDGNLWHFGTSTMPAGNITLVAQWTQHFHHVTFDSNGGSPVDGVDVAVGSFVDVPANPFKEGYTFEGWFNGETKWDFANDAMPANDFELVAHWTINSYTASFDSDGGSAVDSQNVDFGSLVTKPADPVKEGYTFVGWFDGKTEWDFANDTMPVDGVNLTAHWGIVAYTMSFNSNAGTPVDDQSIDFGSLVTRPADPTKEGYTFVGWFDAGTEWDFANSTMPSHDVELYAAWEANLYIAWFDSDGGTPVDSQEVAFESLVTKPADPTKKGYTFVGWFSGGSMPPVSLKNSTQANASKSILGGGTLWDFESDTMPLGGIMLVAHWQPNTYTSSFDSDGGTPVDSQDVDYGSLITKPADPTKEGYTFGGWFNGEIEWDFANDTMPLDGVNLTAHWKVATYTATFDSDGGTSVDSQDVNFGSLITAPSDPTKEGYAFDGWFNGDTEWDFDNNTMPVDGVNLTAHWKVISYTATFDSDGGTAVDAQTVDYAAHITEPADPTKDGYGFVGWYVDGSFWHFGTNTMPANDTTLVAHWTQQFSHVAFDSNGGSAVAGADVAVGSLVDAPADPTRTGYTFEGWFNGETKWDFANDTMPGGDVTLTAHWKVKSIKVVIHVDGDTDTQEVSLDYGQEIVPPTVPTKPGYDFGGWYTDADLTQPFVPGTTADLTDVSLYAKWTPVHAPEFTVVFNSTGGSTIPSAQVGANGTVILPKPAKPGFSFVGWFTSPTGGTKVTALTAVNSNVILYARWISADPYIKSMTVSKGTISPAFTSKHLTYNVYFTGVSNQIVLKVVKPHPASTMSTRVGLTTWRKATTMTTYVKVGQTKTVYFKSVAQDGKTTRTYTYRVFHAWDK